MFLTSATQGIELQIREIPGVLYFIWCLGKVNVEMVFGGGLLFIIHPMFYNPSKI